MNTFFVVPSSITNVPILICNDMIQIGMCSTRREKCEMEAHFGLPSNATHDDIDDDGEPTPKMFCLSQPAPARRSDNPTRDFSVVAPSRIWPVKLCPPPRTTRTKATRLSLAAFIHSWPRGGGLEVEHTNVICGQAARVISAV